MEIGRHEALHIFVRAKTMAGFGEISFPVTITTLQSGMFIYRLIAVPVHVCIYMYLKNAY